MLAYAAAFLACVVALFFASRIVYIQVLGLAKALRVPPFAISLMLVAFSTSIPEFFVGVTSAIDGVPAFSLGDILGSNIVNLTFIAGLVILLARKRMDLRRSIGMQQLLATFAVALAPIALIIDGVLSRTDGALLLALYILYLAYLRSKMRTTRVDAQDTVPTLARTIAVFFFGIALLIGASEGIIFAARGISASLGLAPFVVGVFAIAVSTSLPELTFGIRSALMKAPELSIGDVIGSSAVNATLILGVVALIHPIVPLHPAEVLAVGAYNAGVFAVFLAVMAVPLPRVLRGAILVLTYFGFIAASL